MYITYASESKKLHHQCMNFVACHEIFCCILEIESEHPGCIIPQIRSKRH